MNYIGLDIGSTAAKVVIRGDYTEQFLMPTGWSSRETVLKIRKRLNEVGIDLADPKNVVAATGYGRTAVDFSDFVITEITCHGRGGYALAGKDCTLVDVGGQDTKIIQVENGMVTDFLMNDKCSAGTGKFIEIMSNRLDVTIDELFELAEIGSALPITSLCTVFAESEIIHYISEGQPKENIAAGVIDSVAVKVAQLYSRKASDRRIVLTGGLSLSKPFARVLGEKAGMLAETLELGRYAGALGAAILAEERKRK